MGDFLFSFVGRKNLVQYVISIVCVVLAFAAVIAVQQKLGEWKFASIFTTTLAAVPVTIYLAGTTRRFKDQGLHPLIGFLAFYILPVAVLFGAQWALGDTPLINPETFMADAQGLTNQTQWSSEDLIRWGAIGVACLLFLAGQLTLLLRRSSVGENVFNEAGINT